MGGGPEAELQQLHTRSDRGIGRISMLALRPQDELCERFRVDHPNDPVNQPVNERIPTGWWDPSPT